MPISSSHLEPYYWRWLKCIGKCNPGIRCCTTASPPILRLTSQLQPLKCALKAPVLLSAVCPAWLYLLVVIGCRDHQLGASNFLTNVGACSSHAARRQQHLSMQCRRQRATYSTFHSGKPESPPDTRPQRLAQSTVTRHHGKPCYASGQPRLKAITAQ